jgi:ATP-binding cassette subfamily B protein
MIPLPIIALLVTRFSGMIHDRFDKVQMAFSELSDKAQEAFSGIRVVKAYGDEESENGLFDAKARLNMDQNIHLARVWGFFQPLVATLALAGSAILLSAGGRMVIGGSISLGQFVAFSSYLAMLTWPMMAIGFVVNMLQRGAASMARLMRIINTVPSISDGGDPAVPEPLIEVRGLTFAYPETDTNVLEEVGFTIESGRTLGIVGRTGSGKTTLVELLMRLYDPPRGTVFVGGRDVADLKLHNLRGLFGYVPQETFLFAMTIGENISFGAGSLPAERVRELAETVDIASEIESFPLGFDTVVGERGVTLSGGQKQRVAIARALATNPGILVLDDSLSAVDTETEDVILKAVKRKTRNITTIIISHRISTVQHADLVLVMERGRIVEKGTHEQLLSKDGFYTELYRMQQLEAEAQKTSGGGDN